MATLAEGNANNKKWFWAIVLIVFGITYLHLSTNPDALGIHEFLRRLYYIPVILAAYRFGMKGGVLTAVVCGLVYAPHLLLYMGTPEIQVINQLMEILLFFVVGLTTGIMADTEYRQREELARQLDEVQRMEEEVRRADRLAAVGQLAAGVAHEIRNPLGVIRAAAQIAKEDLLDKPEVSESLEVILKEVDRANNVVTGLLDFARPNAPNFSIIDLSLAVREALRLMTHYAIQQNISIIHDITNEVLKISGDRELIVQAIVNLIMNAVQACPAGSKIEVKVYRQTAPETGQDGYVVEICDNGPGIPSDNLSHIFDPFFTTREQGHGLGLAIVHRIVRDHEGQIRISSTGQGTRVVIWLPRLKGE